MTKLIHFTFMKNEDHCVDGMLDCILPHVDASYVLMDDRSTDNTRDILEARGVNVKVAKFENFAKFKNTLFAWIQEETCGNCWMLGLAPDERVDDNFMLKVKDAVESMHSTEVDGVRISRRHWKDIDMVALADQDSSWYPDWQTRLLRVDYPRIHSTRYVHEIIQGLRQTVMLKDIDVHHFNLVFKDRKRWDDMNQQYAMLQRKQQEDGGQDIWPEEDNE